METMSDLGVTGILEMPPAGTLTGIAKRALKGVETFALKTPDQLDAAREFCDKHGLTPANDNGPGQIVAAGAETYEPGATIGEVASLRDSTTITAAHGGVVVEWLVEDGDLVSPGQPLLRLHPEVGL
jgi:[acyl-carrier-protein] S-malonyltransferase